MKKFWLAMFVLAALPAAAFAQQSGGYAPVATAWGPRFGIGTSPDQFLFGAQLDLGAIAPDLTLTPNVDIGIGDHATTVSFGGDLHYHFRVQHSPWRPYVGGGLDITHISFDSPFGDADDTDVGLNLLFGAIVPTQSGSRFFVEGKLGLDTIQDFKVLAGWNFKL